MEKRLLNSMSFKTAKNWFNSRNDQEWWVPGIIGNGNISKVLIDDVRIYDRALSAEEVQALYNLGQ